MSSYLFDSSSIKVFRPSWVSPLTCFQEELPDFANLEGFLLLSVSCSSHSFNNWCPTSRLIWTVLVNCSYFRQLRDIFIRFLSSIFLETSVFFLCNFSPYCPFFFTHLLSTSSLTSKHFPRCLVQNNSFSKFAWQDFFILWTLEEEESWRNERLLLVFFFLVYIWPGLSFFYRCLLLKMTAIEKLQMLIEAAEYLDRRERGKVTNYYI